MQGNFGICSRLYSLHLFPEGQYKSEFVNKTEGKKEATF